MTEHDRPDRSPVGTAGAGSSDPPQHVSGAGMPRWVKGFAIVGVALVLLIVIMLMTGHGPSRHMSGLGQSPGTVPTPSIAMPEGLHR